MFSKLGNMLFSPSSGEVANDTNNDDKVDMNGDVSSKQAAAASPPIPPPTSFGSTPTFSITPSRGKQLGKLRGKRSLSFCKSVPARSTTRETEETEPTAASAMGISRMNPRLSFAGMQSRSISKVFNQLPTVLPSLDEIQQDIVEWLLHIALLETDPKRFEIHEKKLSTAMKLTNIATYGRLCSRLKLTALWGDFTREPLPREQKASLPLSDKDWANIKDELQKLRSTLLRKDANEVVTMITVPKNEQSQEGSQPLPYSPAPIEEKDSQLEGHAMMQEDYEEVYQLIQVQELLSNFHGNLLRTTMTPTASTQLAVDEYKAQLTALFDKDLLSSSPSANDNNDSLARLRYVSHSSNVPEGLRNFLEVDGNETENWNIVLLNHIQDKLFADSYDEHSLGYVRQKVHSLLLKWSESILELPTLIQLGYGGVNCPLSRIDDADVSSFGDDDDREMIEVDDGQNGDKSSGDAVALPQMNIIERFASAIASDGPRDTKRKTGSNSMSQQPRSAKRRCSSRHRHSSGKKEPPTQPRQNENLEENNFPGQASLNGEDDEDEEPLMTQVPECLDPKETQQEKVQGEGGGNLYSPCESDCKDEDPQKHEEKRMEKDNQAANNKKNLVSDVTEFAAKVNRRRLDAWFDDSDSDCSEAVREQQGRRHQYRQSPHASSKMSRRQTPMKGTKKNTDLWSDSDNEVVQQQRQSSETSSRRSSSRGLQKRVFFTADEVNAIRQGVARYGIGRWKKIKENSEGQLDSRSTVQIKDKYRNMVNNGQI